VTVAILVSGLPPDRIGGAEMQAAQLARYLAARHDVFVYTRTARVPDELTNLPTCRVIRRCRVDMRGLRFAVDVVQTLWTLWRVRKQVDIICAYQTVIDGFIAVLAKRLTGIPVVVSVRSAMEYRMAEYRQSRVFAPFVFKGCDRIAVQSPLIAEDLAAAFASSGDAALPELLRQRLCVLPNGIDVHERPNGAGEAALFVGRLETVKGADYAIDAMRHCPAERLIVVGDGPERQALEDRARGLSNVTFAGMLPPAEVRRQLARAKMLVVPSRQEGQPNVILEAMAAGVPVIASAVGAIPEMVRDGETGFLTQPGDIRMLAEYIRAVGQNAELRSRLSMQSVALMEHYRWPRVIEQVEQVLGDVITARRLSASRPHSE
jgi:glycogen(starch) synthase